MVVRCNYIHILLFPMILSCIYSFEFVYRDNKLNITLQIMVVQIVDNNVYFTIISRPVSNAINMQLKCYSISRDVPSHAIFIFTYFSNLST